MKTIDELKAETKSDLEAARRRRLDRENPLGAARRDLEVAQRDGSVYVSPLWPPPGDPFAAHAPRGIDVGNRSLAQVLQSLGYQIAPRTGVQQGKQILRRGEVVFEGTADETWEWLRKTRQIA